MSAPAKNKNAVKADADKASATLYVRTTAANRAVWDKAAKRAGEKITKWAVRVMNEGAAK